MPSNARNHQYLFVPARRKASLRDFHPVQLQSFPSPPPLSANPLGALKCFTLQNQCRHQKHPPFASPFYHTVCFATTVSSGKSHNYWKCILILLSPRQPDIHLNARSSSNCGTCCFAISSTESSEIEEKKDEEFYLKARMTRYYGLTLLLWKVAKRCALF